MEYNSFYGGRRGASFVIVRTYTSIPEMCTDFRGEEGSNPPNFQEYVLIETENKSHPDNGKLFRRGFDFNSDRIIQYTDLTRQNPDEQDASRKYIFSTNAYGAEYIGDIVGPAGNAPQISLTTPPDPLPTGAQVIQGNQESDNASINFVPGKNNNTYNDNVVYNWYSVRLANQNDTTLYLGMTIPYMVYSFTASPIDFAPDETELIHQVTPVNPSDVHKFYKEWHIDIPRGEAIAEIKNITATSTTGDISIQNNHTIYVGQTATCYLLQGDAPAQGYSNYYYIADYNVVEDSMIDGVNLLVKYTNQREADYQSGTYKKINEVIWKIIGPIKNYNGTLIKGTFSPTGIDLTNTNAVIDWLNEHYQEGLQGENNEDVGKIVQIGNYLYAFDYNAADTTQAGQWFKINITNAHSCYAKPSSTDSITDNDLLNMEEKGLWFVVESFGSTS